MKKSASVPVILVASIAALAATGCSPRTQVRRCADDKGNWLPDDKCEHTTSAYYGGYGRGHGYPRWVYGGDVGGDGRTLRNYATSPSDGARVVSSSGRVISRGGFGGSSSRSGGYGGFGG